jgi:hypothetical protein
MFVRVFEKRKRVGLEEGVVEGWKPVRGDWPKMRRNASSLAAYGIGLSVPS